MKQAEADRFLLELEGTWLSFPFGEDQRVYKYGDESKDEGKIFAIIQQDSDPLRISLRCDSQLAELLREKYETVVPGVNLNKKYWNTIICSGQLNDEEIKDLIRLSYQLAMTD